MHPTVRELDALLRRLERPAKGVLQPRVSTGCEPLDAALPGQGFLRGSLVEWLAGGLGCGAGMLALRAAREACREGGALVVIDPHHNFYPPAAAAWGVDLHNTIVVRAAQGKENQRHKQSPSQQSLWALDQALRCPHVAAVVAWPTLESRVFRRLQLAVETSGCLGLLVRSATARREASWADVRLMVSPVEPALQTLKPLDLSWRLKIEVLRCRGGPARRTVDLEIDERTGEIHAPTHPGHLATQLADSAVDPRQARA